MAGYDRINQICQTVEQAPMAEYTSFKAGGVAALLALPTTEEQLQKVMQIVTEEKLPHYLMGNGSNILVKDGGFQGVIIRLAEGFQEVESEGTTIRAGAGALLSVIAKRALAENLTGLEFASGIPGSLGGAVYMNAGAYDGEMKQVLKTVRVMSKDGKEIREVPAGELDLSYRHSALMERGDIVLSAELALQPGEHGTIAARMKELAERRNTKQPLQYPSAGSFFKRPTGYFAGKLIEDAGCKGLRVGGAQISTLHSGFMINTGGATATDIVTLMHLVQARVKEQFGVDMEPEVRIIGEDK